MGRTAKISVIILIICVGFVYLAACGDAGEVAQGGGAGGNGGEAAGDGGYAEADGGARQIVRDNVPDMDLDGYIFRILSSGEERAWHGIINIEELTGELVNDSIYMRNRIVEERFNIIMYEVHGYHAIRASVRAGSDDWSFVTGWCDPMFGFFIEGLGHHFDDYGYYIDLSKPYWDEGLTKAFTFGDKILFPVGAVDITTYDLIHVLLFNKQLLADFGLDCPYALVRGGNWTFDAYEQMVRYVTRDLDGSGIMDENDMYGLVSMVKYVMPNFWVAAGVQTVGRTENHLPEFTLLGDERFGNVIDRIFAMTWDNNSWFRNTDDFGNWSDVHNAIFMSDRALFFNNTFKMVAEIRAMETDFGILPYPKFTADQPHHFTRMEGCFPFIIPITVPNPAQIGAIVEVMASESLINIVPAYFELSLQTIHARDEESAEMLDIIFENRVLDLGDSIWCHILRDGIFVQMFANNDRNLVSRLERIEPRMNREIERALEALELY